MKDYIVYQIDAFSDKKFSGNPAGVVINADGLTKNQMQNIARELNNPETAFVFKDSSSKTSHCIKFFTPTKEVPICSHATIAAHYALALEKNIKEVTNFTQTTQAGDFEIQVSLKDNDYLITMTQDNIQYLNILNSSEIKELLNALNICQSDLIQELPIQIVSTGNPKVMIGLKSYELLENLRPNMEKLILLSEKIACNGYFVFTFDTKEQDILTQGRMFAPSVGINEDPVTGNAHGPLAAYLYKYGFLNKNQDKIQFYSKQGKPIKREGKIFIELYTKNNKIIKVKISGNAKVVFKTTITI